MNREILREIYEIMKEHWDNGGVLFERKNFPQLDEGTEPARRRPYS